MIIGLKLQYYCVGTSVEYLLTRKWLQSVQWCTYTRLSLLSLFQNGNLWDLVAHGALEAACVPLVPPGQLLLSGIHRFAALWAFGHLDRLERHLLRFLSARCRFA